MATPTYNISVLNNGDFAAEKQSSSEHPQYYQLLQDDKMPWYSRPSDSKLTGKPGVMRFERHHYTLLEEWMQWLWFNLNRNPRFTDQKHRQAWLAYTDPSAGYNNAGGIYDSDSGRWVGRDFINDEGEGLPLPKIATLGTINNVVRGRETTAPYNAGHMTYGEPVLEVETIMDEPKETLSYETHPWLIHKAVVIVNVKAPNGWKKVNPFPQFSGRLSG